MARVRRKLTAGPSTRPSGWFTLVASVALKSSLLTLSTFGSAWIATRLHLALLATAPSETLSRAGVHSPADVPRLMATVSKTFATLSPIVFLCFAAVIGVVRVLEWRRQKVAVIRAVCGVLCGGIAASALVFAVIGFYEPITPIGLLAGTASAILLGAFCMSPAFRRPRTV